MQVHLLLQFVFMLSLESSCLRSAMANTIPQKLEYLTSMEILSFMSHDRAESGL